MSIQDLKETIAALEETLNQVDAERIADRLVLLDHCAHLEDQVVEYAKQNGVDPNLAISVVRAAWVHRIGEEAPTLENVGEFSTCVFNDTVAVLEPSDDGVPPDAVAIQAKVNEMTAQGKKPRSIRELLEVANASPPTTLGK